MKTIEANNITSILKKHNFRGKTILISDDDSYSSLLLEIYLIEAGADIIHATNGIEAIKICNKQAQINLVLMDIFMPKLDGLSAAKKIKTKLPNLPIIIQTSSDSNSLKNKAIMIGCEDFVIKPINKNIILNKITQYIN